MVGRSGRPGHKVTDRRGGPPGDGDPPDDGASGDRLSGRSPYVRVMSDSESDGGSEEGRVAVVLDYLAHGRSDDDRPQYQKSPLAYAVGVEDFHLFELTLDREADVGIGDEVVVEPRDARHAGIETVRRVDHDDLSGGARSELEYVVEDIVDGDERRFVDFYNDAQPVTLRLHQLNLLPGIGKKLRNAILDQRKRGPFESFEDLTDRVDGLHNPKKVIVERIMEELREDDLKYRTFARRDDE
jgi:putative nucleotide binding protein